MMTRGMLPVLGWRGTPFFGGDIGYRLRKRPPVASKVLNSVLPLAERVIGWGCENPCAELFRVLEVSVNVFNMHVDVLADLAGTWWPKLSIVR